MPHRVYSHESVYGWTNKWAGQAIPLANRVRPKCQRKVEMSGFLPDRNVLFQGFLQG